MKISKIVSSIAAIVMCMFMLTAYADKDHGRNGFVDDNGTHDNGKGNDGPRVDVFVPDVKWPFGGDKPGVGPCDPNCGNVDKPDKPEHEPEDDKPGVGPCDPNCGNNPPVDPEHPVEPSEPCDDCDPPVSSDPTIKYRYLYIYKANRYDGIWMIDKNPNLLLSVHQKAKEMVIVGLNNHDSSFAGFAGPITGTVAEVSSIEGYSTGFATFNVQFKTNNDLIARQKLCVNPNETYPCRYTYGPEMIGRKVF